MPRHAGRRLNRLPAAPLAAEAAAVRRPHHNQNSHVRGTGVAVASTPVSVSASGRGLPAAREPRAVDAPCPWIGGSLITAAGWAYCELNQHGHHNFWCLTAHVEAPRPRLRSPPQQRAAPPFIVAWRVWHVPTLWDVLLKRLCLGRFSFRAPSGRCGAFFVWLARSSCSKPRSFPV
jgi:hypothetical protein